LTGYDTKGSGVSVTLSHDWQSDTVVMGLYASLGSVHAKGGTSQALTVSQMEGTTIEHHGFDTDLSRLASAGGRIGVVVNDNMLLYAKAGIASGQLKIVETGDNAGAARKVDKSGYVVGAGVDLQLDDKWTLGVAWTHYDLGKAGFSPAAYGAGEIGVKGDIAELGLSYRF
jgi:opacity protein-like surface antigen